MGRFSANDVDNYGGSGGAGFFKLAGDKDVARVRFLYNTPEDVEGYAVHKVQINGKDRYVNCLRDYNQPVEDCPFCRERVMQQAKLFVPLYNIDQDQVQIWDRGKTFFAKMSSILSRCRANPIVGQVYEIERNGKPGDTSTKYEIFESREAPDDTTLDDFEMPQVLGGIVLDKSFEDMEYYLETKEFPPNDQEEPLVRRSGPTTARGQRDREEPATRGTGRARRSVPARGRGNNEDVY